MYPYVRKYVCDIRWLITKCCVLLQGSRNSSRSSSPSVRMMPTDKTSSRGYFSPDDTTGTHDFPTEVSNHISIEVRGLKQKKTFAPKRKESSMWKDVRYLQYFLFTMRLIVGVSSHCSPSFTVGVSQFSQSMIWFNLCECCGGFFSINSWAIFKLTSGFVRSGYFTTTVWLYPVGFLLVI